MEKDRGTKVIAIIALCVAVVGLSIGFAAFTKDLNITFSESNVNVSGELDIKFLASEDVNDTSTTVDGMVVAADGGDTTNMSANVATISSDGTTISGLGVTFSDKDQAVYYDFYIYNNSEYDAYLKAIDFLNYEGTETNKVCTALEGTTQSLVDDACEDIHIGLGVGATNVIDTSQSGFTSVKIPSGEIVSAVITIIYAGDLLNEELGTSGSALLPNGDFKINIGDIKFSYSSLEG